MQSKHTMWGVLAALAVSSLAFADAPAAATDVASELGALKARIAELEKAQNENWLTEQRSEQIKGLVQEVIADARARGQFQDSGLLAGYNKGFFLKSADDNFLLKISGRIQVRYTFAFQDKKNNAVNATASPSDDTDVNGFSIRRAVLNFSGNVLSKDLTYAIEGEFSSGNDGGGFLLNQAWIGYSFGDALKFRAGAYDAPFSRTNLVSNGNLGFAERPEILAPFEPAKTIGASVYGDFVKDVWSYDVELNNGGDGSQRTKGTTGNGDNRLAVYARTVFAGAGVLKDFSDESDLRDPAKGRDLVWSIGGAVGYDSQANDAGTKSLTLKGLGTNNAPGFSAPINLRGDVFRGTLDFAAKYEGWSLLVAGFFQQVNSSNTISNFQDSSGFEYAGYAQVGYLIIPKKLELLARIGALATEDSPNIGTYYSVGANYYLFGTHTAKIQSDVTFAPAESALSSSGAANGLNTQDIVARVTLQLGF